ncbi:hypothetical protein ABTL42_19740, partial [Acinetobacter baumannii]
MPLNKLHGAKNKERVVVKMVRWEKEDKKPIGEVKSMINATDANDGAMKELLAENGFPLGFEEAVLKETAKLSDKLDEKEIT